MIDQIKGDDWLSHLQSRQGQDRHPLAVQWEITCRCNLKCVMCYTDCFNTPSHIAQELSSEEIFRIMDEMKEAGVLEMTLTGGEPMARSDFREIYLRAVQNGFLTTVFTNGTYINEEWIELWGKYPPHRIEISIHGATRKIFDQVTTMSGSYDRVMKSVELVASAKIPLIIKTTGTNLNQHEVLAIKTKMAEKSGIQSKFSFHLRSQADGDEDPYRYQLSDEAIDQILNADPDFKQASKELDEKSEACPTVCHEGKKQFHVDAYGRLQLCSRNRTNSYDLRSGSFKEGFYKNLPTFSCPRKNTDSTCCSVTPKEVNLVSY